jgi:hypothetical protein
VIAAGAWIAMRTALPAFVAREATAAAGTTITVERVPFGLLPPRVDLAGLRIPNPPGYGGADLLAIDRLSMRLEASSLLGDRVRLSEVRVEGFTLRLERVGGRTNLDALRDRVRVAQAANRSASRRIVIGVLRVRGGRVSAPAPFGRRVNVPVRDLELKNVGGDKAGLAPAELADLLLRLMDPSLRNAARNVDLGGAVRGLLP